MFASSASAGRSNGEIAAGGYLFESSDWRLTTPSCTGNVSTVSLSDGLAAFVFDLTVHRRVVFRWHGAVPRLIELGFVTSGAIDIDVQGQRRGFDTLVGQNYATLFEGNFGVSFALVPGQQVRLVEIRFTPAALNRCCDHLGCSLPFYLSEPLSSLQTPKSVKCASVLTQEMAQIVNEIAAHVRTSTLCNHFMMRKSLALTALYLTFAHSGMRATTTTLPPREIERIRTACNILTTSMDHPPSLSELARMVNLNDYKLKLGFRQAYGTTAYGYLKEHRLQRAYQLLREQRKSVTETALAVGYRNLGDFGMAFKQRFGMSPRNIRQREKSGFR